MAKASVDSSAIACVTVTPNNTNNVTWTDSESQIKYMRGLYVGGAGNVAVQMIGDNANVTFIVPAGTELAVRATKVLYTGTTATNIIALF